MPVRDRLRHLLLGDSPTTPYQRRVRSDDPADVDAAARKAFGMRPLRAREHAIGLRRMPNGAYAFVSALTFDGVDSVFDHRLRADPGDAMLELHRSDDGTFYAVGYVDPNDDEPTAIFLAPWGEYDELARIRLGPRETWHPQTTAGVLSIER